ncbi:MAG: prefoldin subunit beta [Candidatus Pacearchaeota archaeon]|nr:prefoldin subunit beta [Candidatus Pacearchaeota archaeon]
MGNDEETIQEMQVLEQNLHNLLLQKQAFQMELSETKSALKEIDKSGEIFRLIGELMIKTDKEKAKEDLIMKEKVLDMRIKSIEKQEDSLGKRLQELRDKFSNLAK